MIVYRSLLNYSLNSPSRARTYNPAVNSRVLYHWAIEDYCFSTLWRWNFLFTPLTGRLFIFLPAWFQLHVFFLWAPYPQNQIPKIFIRFSLPFPFGQALDRLVHVSFIHYCTSTSCLSTSYSSRGLTFRGISHLEGGFTLRCLQRLSLPDLATLPWRWYANRYTSGPSIPVLSY